MGRRSTVYSYLISLFLLILFCGQQDSITTAFRAVYSVAAVETGGKQMSTGHRN